MKWMKLAAAAALAFAYGNAYAFHDGGAAECDGCHVMHNASGGTAAKTKANPYNNLGNSYLLQGSDQSSTCLLCHSGARTNSSGKTSQYHIANLDTAAGVKGDTTQANYTPGGDFGWLTATFTYSPRAGTTVTSLGERHGHNVVASDFGLVADGKLPVAPGGTFAYGTGKAAFACSSCHDPHGRYRIQAGSTGTSIVGGGAATTNHLGSAIDPIVASGSYGDVAPTAGQAIGVYRLLAGKDYAPVSNPSFPFSNDPPIAVAPKDYNHPEYGTATDAKGEVRVAYGTGMSEWCQNCHTNIHLDAYVTGAPGLRHPAGSDAKFRQVQADIYNAYKGSGDLSATTQYTSIVPFETGVTDVTALAAVASTTAAPGTGDDTILKASTSSNVMCLSCHRAHASGFDSMTRWDNLNTFLVEAGYVDGDYGKTIAQQQASFYGRSVGNGFEAFQRSLCNKCHAKD